jgi:hypothetical protein
VASRNANNSSNSLNTTTTTTTNTTNTIHAQTYYAINGTQLDSEEQNQVHQMIQFFRSKSMDYRGPHDQAFSLQAPNTGKWFLDSEPFLRWKDETKKGTARFLACQGSPGAGKTVMR